jgi:2-keto-3-deoxy-6-phosphogluconate aldolase
VVRNLFDQDTRVLPCIKLKAKDDFLAYAQAKYDGGARVIEVTMTTPGALGAIKVISSAFQGKPVPMDLMRHQCESGLKWLKATR